VAAAARHLELELVVVVAGQHDESALRAADFDRRIQHQREHVVEDAAGAERAQPFEQRRDLTQVADRGGRHPVDRRLRFGQQEDHLRPAGPAQPDAIAMDEDAVGDLLAVDVGAVARIAVPQREVVALERDFRVVARDFAAREPQVVGLAPADLELVLGNRNDAPAEGVGDFEAGVGHGEQSRSTAAIRGPRPAVRGPRQVQRRPRRRNDVKRNDRPRRQVRAEGAARPQGRRAKRVKRVGVGPHAHKEMQTATPKSPQRHTDLTADARAGVPGR
jgi:hypothetical protein